ncbi:MAG: hypothetical protein ABL911_10670 [Gallionella sp.]|nr:hypothetical protein [Gallionella sp.]
MKNLLIYNRLVIVLQRILDAVNNGHTHYVCGSCSIDKIEQLLANFDMNYQACASRYQRLKRVRMGLGNVHLVLWYNHGVVYWWLLATAPELGRHPIHETDNLKNALVVGERIEINGYELVRLPKKGTAQTKLTWRMTSSKFENFHNGIVEAVRSRSHQRMRNILDYLWMCPGFNGIRVQTGNLAAMYRAEVKHASVKDAPMPRKRLYYLNRIDHIGISVKQLLSQVKAKT